jgi:putative ATP-binding cassette transporter
MLGWLPFLRRYFAFAGPYWLSERKWIAGALTIALILINVVQVGVPVALNIWMRSLFDALQNRAMSRFVDLTFVLAGLVVVNVIVNTVHLLIKRRLQVDWRNWLTRRVIAEWMESGRHYQLAYMPGEHDNPDGRIAEDARVTTEYALDLADSLVYCAVLLASFVEILWTLSGPPEVRFGAVSFYLPGHLVWFAFVYAAIGASVALLLGRPLVRSTERRQAFEADFRFGLVNARENSFAIALAHGEAIERRRFRDLFRGVAAAWDRQTAALARVMLYSASWNILWQVFPIVIVAPRFIAGTISLGVLMQTAQAFQQATAALSWPIDNLSKLADWRASVRRVMALEYAIGQVADHVTTSGQSGIEILATDKPALRFNALSPCGPDGQAEIAAFSAEINPGDQVLIEGEPGVAATLYKVVAGLWPWGQGSVELPVNATLFFMPEKPYLPLGTLREAISYPSPSADFNDSQMQAALGRVGLDHLVARLDETSNWDEALQIDDQQRLGFARLLLHRPGWIFINNATDALGPKGEEEMRGILRAEFPDATIVSLGQHPPLDSRRLRKLVLTPHKGAFKLQEAPRAEAGAA